MTYRLSPRQDPPISLDLRDQKILSILSENSRTPIAKIAKKYRINRDTVAYKIKRMMDAKLITQFTILANLRQFDYMKFQIFFLVKEGAKKKEFVEAMLKHKHTISLMEYHDTWDFGWKLCARNFEEFEALTVEIYSKFADLILEKEHFVVVESYVSTKLPYNYYEDFELRIGKKHKLEHKIDELDKNILRELSRDSKQSALEIARKTKLLLIQ